VLVSSSVGLGLATAARLFPPSMRRAVLTLHQQTALAALASIVAHGVLLLPDRWLHPGAVGIAVPLAIGYRPVATGLGILAGYVAAVLGLSFYARRRIGARLWRRLHIATLAVYFMALAHVLTAGTDAAAIWMRALLALTLAPIAGLLVLRVIAGTRRAAQKTRRTRQPLAPWGPVRPRPTDPASSRAARSAFRTSPGLGVCRDPCVQRSPSSRLASSSMRSSRV
jgi:sulfoxide reductase heme-binding subunit YedZ